MTKKLKPSKTPRPLLSQRRPTTRTRTSDVARESLVARQLPLSAQPHPKTKNARKLKMQTSSKALSRIDASADLEPRLTRRSDPCQSKSPRQMQLALEEPRREAEDSRVDVSHLCFRTKSSSSRMAATTTTETDLFATKDVRVLLM